jgi:hypothetical protein
VHMDDVMDAGVLTWGDDIPLALWLHPTHRASLFDRRDTSVLGSTCAATGDGSSQFTAWSAALAAMQQRLQACLARSRASSAPGSGAATGAATPGKSRRRRS